MQLFKDWLAVARTFILPWIACTANFLRTFPQRVMQVGCVHLASTPEIQAGVRHAPGLCASGNVGFVRHEPGEIQWDCFHPIGCTSGKLVLFYRTQSIRPKTFLAMFLVSSFGLCLVLIQLILMNTPTVCNVHSATGEFTWLVYPIPRTQLLALYALE